MSRMLSNTRESYQNLLHGILLWIIFRVTISNSSHMLFYGSITEKLFQIHHICYFMDLLQGNYFKFLSYVILWIYYRVTISNSSQMLFYGSITGNLFQIHLKCYFMNLLQGNYFKFVTYVFFMDLLQGNNFKFITYVILWIYCRVTISNSSHMLFMDLLIELIYCSINLLQKYYSKITL